VAGARGDPHVWRLFARAFPQCGARRQAGYRTSSESHGVVNDAPVPARVRKGESAVSFAKGVLIALGICGSAALLVGRSGAAERLTPDTHRAARPAAKLFVSRQGSQTVAIYDPAGHLHGRLTGCGNPAGLTVDASQNLYVADDLNDVVDVFPPGATSPSAVLQNGSDTPKEVTVGGDGTVYASDITDYPGTITVWAPGNLKPTGHITDTKVASFAGVALDANNNLFAAWYVSGQGGVDEVPSGSKTPTNLGLKSLLVPIGIAVDKRGNLVVADAGCACLQIFAQGATSPTRTIHGFMQPTELAFNAKENLLFVTDAQAGDVVIINYKAGTIARTITAGLSASDYPWGVALSPAARP
jgi:hypothetical protein